MKLSEDKTGYKLVNGDCLEVLPTLDITVDLVLVDLPYGVTDCKWDSVISFEAMWDCLEGLSHDTTNFLFFGVEPFSSNLRMSNLDVYRYDLYWVKNRCTGFLHAKNKPLSSIELISVFSNGFVNHKQLTDRRMTYNPQGLRRVEQTKIVSNKPKWKNQVGTTEKIYNKSSFKHSSYTPKYTNYPRQVIYFDSVSRTVHPTQKPVNLLEYLVKTYSNCGDTVLDFTMGSGSTGVACMNTGRKFIGIELDEQYYEIAEKRIAEASHEKQTRLI